MWLLCSGDCAGTLIRRRPAENVPERLRVVSASLVPQESKHVARSACHVPRVHFVFRRCKVTCSGVVLAAHVLPRCKQRHACVLYATVLRWCSPAHGMPRLDRCDPNACVVGVHSVSACVGSHRCLSALECAALQLHVTPNKLRKSTTSNKAPSLPAHSVSGRRAARQGGTSCADPSQDMEG